MTEQTGQTVDDHLPASRSVPDGQPDKRLWLAFADSVSVSLFRRSLDFTLTFAWSCENRFQVENTCQCFLKSFLRRSHTYPLQFRRNSDWR
jgi:hypothetical protein